MFYVLHFQKFIKAKVLDEPKKACGRLFMTTWINDIKSMNEVNWKMREPFAFEVR